MQPDAFSFNALIQSYFRMNKVHKAEKHFDSMLRLGIQPDNYTFGAFIKPLCKSGRHDKAKKMFLSMKVNGCTPDSYTCSLINDTLAHI